MNKIAIYFMNDNGNYYIENAAVFTGDEIPATGYKHNPAIVVDETENWEYYLKTKEELSNPTTKDGEVFIVVQKLNS